MRAIPGATMAWMAVFGLAGCGAASGAGRCLPRVPGETPAAAVESSAAWVAWTTPQGWLHVGTRAEYERVEPLREEIWGGTSNEPVEKELLGAGPWSTQAAALDEVCAMLGDVRVATHPGASPGETIRATIDGREVNVQLGRGMLPEDVFWTAQQYDHGEQIRILHEHGISPRVVFAAPRWLAHVTGVGTMDGPQARDQWFLLDFEPSGGGFTLPDGMGGTFGYSYDRLEGPFADSFEVVPVLRELGLPYAGDVSVDLVLDDPVDHGLPRCAP
ncbi:MAG: hypothetical protein HY907_22670 [Deltaproteobacteria bacterium]|nr:hypothetical protein [Deltaproteobacteria bacterium]